MQQEKKSQKALSVQIDSVYGKKEETLTHVEKFLEPYLNTPIDMIVLPEFALNGYIHDEYFPLAEFQDGWHFQKMSELAKKFNAYVVCGYPEKELKPELANQNVEENNKDSFNQYNSAMLIDRSGKLHHHYRKSCYWKTDIKHFLRGPGYTTCMIKNLKGQDLKISVAICQDIVGDIFYIEQNQVRPGIEYPLGSFLRDERVDFLIFPTAFCGNKNYSKEEGMKWVNFWVKRLLPLDKDLSKDHFGDDIQKVGYIKDDENPKSRLEDKQVGVVICDRVGEEKGTAFRGMSCWFVFNPFQMGETLGTQEEGVLVCDVFSS